MTQGADGKEIAEGDHVSVHGKAGRVTGIHEGRGVATYTENGTGVTRSARVKQFVHADPSDIAGPDDARDSDDLPSASGVAPSINTPSGPLAADGAPLAIGHSITVNGHVGTTTSVKPDKGVALFHDTTGTQRSAKIASVTHLKNPVAGTTLQTEQVSEEAVPDES